MTFDSGIQKMKCPYCDTEFEMADMLTLDADLQTPAPEETPQGSTASDWQDGETDGMQVFVCRSCGGEIVADENTGATACPFCGNPVVMKERFSGDLRPDLILPFKLDKAAAKAGLLRHLQGKRLLPRVFVDENHIDEIRGVYVPFWLYDSEADADIVYRATRERRWSDSRYNYVETSHFDVYRSGRVQFQAVPVDGSSKMADDLMESIEPFDLSEAVPFQTAYLSGYLADRYDVNAEQSAERAAERIRVSTEECFAGTVENYNTVMPDSSDVRMTNTRCRYILYPVWLLNTSWNGQNYLFAMNGQTGKFVGDLPMDRAARRRWFFGITGIGTAVLFALARLLWAL